MDKAEITHQPSNSHPSLHTTTTTIISLLPPVSLCVFFPVLVANKLNTNSRASDDAATDTRPATMMRRLFTSTSSSSRAGRVAVGRRALSVQPLEEEPTPVTVHHSSAAAAPATAPIPTPAFQGETRVMGNTRAVLRNVRLNRWVGTLCLLCPIN